MRSTFTIAALAGAAIAAPSWGGYGANKPAADNVHIVMETVVHTVYLTEGYGAPEPTPAPTPAAAAYTPPAYQPAPVVTSVVYEAPQQPAPAPEAPKPTPTPQPAPEQPAPAPSSSAAPAPPASGGYMATVDEYRSKMGLPKITQDSKLEANALDTAASGNGQMVHKLNAGTMGQTLAPGGPEDFVHVYVGGWLCEMPNLPGLDGVCAEQSKGWDYQGQTGHAEILTDKSYTKIGCANAGGIWCCDVA